MWKYDIFYNNMILKHLAAIAVAYIEDILQITNIVFCLCLLSTYKYFRWKACETKNKILETVQEIQLQF